MLASDCSHIFQLQMESLLTKLTCFSIQTFDKIVHSKKSQNYSSVLKQNTSDSLFEYEGRGAVVEWTTNSLFDTFVLENVKKHSYQKIWNLLTPPLTPPPPLPPTVSTLGNFFWRHVLSFWGCLVRCETDFVTFWY